VTIKFRIFNQNRYYRNCDYGKFIHIMDIESNKIELWESNDAAYEKLGIKMYAKTIKLK
jgi:hypothetical protein